MKVPIVSGVEENVGNPLINSGIANFIQVYVNENPYFRAGEENHSKILEKFLKEVNINDFGKEERKKRYGFGTYFAPHKKERLYELVGCGIIEEANMIKENTDELEGRGYLAIRGYSEEYILYPNIKHISKILKHFKDPLVFVGSEYWTEEERGFVENYNSEDIEDDNKGGMFDSLDEY